MACTRTLLYGLPTRRVLAAAFLTAIFVASATAIDGHSKGPDFYAPLSVSIAGRSGQRTFDASGGADGQAVWEFVQQVADPSDSPVPAQTVGNPGLTDYYELHFDQDPAANMKLPWTGMPTARFYYYPARGTTRPHVRLRLAHESEAAQDTWVAATPSLIAMVERHARDLAPDSSEPKNPSIPIADLAAAGILGASLLVATVIRLKMPLSVPSRHQ